MHQIFASTSVSITELKRSPSAVIERAGGAPVAVLNHNCPAAYLLSAATYEALLDRLDDIDLIEIVKVRRNEPAVEVDPHDL
jgi:antitoxin StbD